MNHKTEVIYITMNFVCSECKQFVRSMKAIPMAEITDDVLRRNYGVPASMGFALVDVWHEVQEHKCDPNN